MQQKTAYTFAVVGLVVFGYMVKEIIGDHQSWHELTTPQAVGHAAAALAGFGVAAAGLLGIDLSKLLEK